MKTLENELIILRELFRIFKNPRRNLRNRVDDVRKHRITRAGGSEALGENTGLTRVFDLSVACNAKQKGETE